MATTPFKAYATRPAPDEIVQYLRENNIELTCWTEDHNPTAEQLLTTLTDYTAFLNVSYGKMDRAFLSAIAHLKCVCTYSVGYDHIDVAAATEVGLPVGNTPDVLSHATANTAFLLMIMASRRAQYNYNRMVEAGKWGFSRPLDHCGWELHGKTVGIFGLGRIGAEFALLCQNAYKMKVIYHNRNRNEVLEEQFGDNIKYVTFDELLAQSDVISVHAFASPENANKFNKETFGKMKKTAILVNTARGSLVNEDDLVEAVNSKTIFAAGLDVFKIEPLPQDSALRTNHDICLLPHIGSATIETRMAMWKSSADNLIAGCRGEPLPACINPAVYEKKE